jgi:hypothetical protein
MTITPSEARHDVSEAIRHGEVIRFRHFNISGADAGYDDDVALTQSGIDFWVSGLEQPITSRDMANSQNQVLVEQGRLLEGDMKMYVLGDVNVSGIFRIGVGSANPPNREYSVIKGGILTWKLGGEPIYHKIYLRYLTTGSLSGE